MVVFTVNTHGVASAGTMVYEIVTVIDPFPAVPVHTSVSLQGAEPACLIDDPVTTISPNAVTVVPSPNVHTAMGSLTNGSGLPNRINAVVSTCLLYTSPSP